MARKRHIPPSRQRYEQSHPVIAIRVDKALYDELKAIKESDGKSFGDILRLGLKIQKAAATKSYQKGYSKGYADTEGLFSEKLALANQRAEIAEGLQRKYLERALHAENRGTLA